tara:strand:+ start:397 stop:699 length:303 start_codon:yes stop_codon:yes gene_type:complete
VQASSTATRRFTLPAATQASFNWSTTFNSASELAAALLRLGKDFNVLQLSPGRLHGHFSVGFAQAREPMRRRPRNNRHRQAQAITRTAFEQLIQPSLKIL